MADSFYIPPVAADHLTELLDVTLTNADKGQSLIYDWNQSQWINSDPLTDKYGTIIGAVAGRYYFSRNQSVGAKTYGAGAFLTPIQFNNSPIINKFCIGVGSNPDSTAGNSGMKFRAYIYDANANGIPNVIHADLGYHELLGGDLSGITAGGAEFTLDETVILNPHTLYYIGFAFSPIDTEDTNLATLFFDQPGLTHYWYNHGIPDTDIQYGILGACGWDNLSEDWTSFDFEEDNLANNIHSDVYPKFDPPRMGIRVNGLD